MENCNQVVPDLGSYICTLLSRADPTKIWANLLSKSTHINHLVDLGVEWTLVPEKVARHVKNNSIVVNMSADPFNRYEESVVGQLSKHAENFVVLSGDVSYLSKPVEHICFFPFWYLNQKYSYAPISIIDRPRTYKVSCMNKNSRYHRILNFIKLRKKSYFKDMLFGMLYHYDSRQVRLQTPYELFDANILAEFHTLLPKEVCQLDGQDAHAIDLPAYTDSYCNFVTETSIYNKTIFVSEKTWRPFMAAQFGLWLSNPGCVDFLRLCGFDVFDDVFSGHAYDREPNLNQRIEQVHQVIDQIMTVDLDQVFMDTLDRRQANMDLFYSQHLENLLTKQCTHIEFDKFCTGRLESLYPIGQGPVAKWL